MHTHGEHIGTRKMVFPFARHCRYRCAYHTNLPNNITGWNEEEASTNTFSGSPLLHASGNFCLQLFYNFGCLTFGARAWHIVSSSPIVFFGDLSAPAGDIYSRRQLARCLILGKLFTCFNFTYTASFFLHFCFF